jgi:hypothetical protein
VVQQFWVAFNRLKYIFIIVLAAGLILLYKNVDPAAGTLFPQCPFRQLTGYQCPGCGSQRAVHQLLNFHVKEAFSLNALLVLSIPYLMVGFVLEKISLSKKLLIVRRALYGPTATIVVLIVVLAFWIGRNIG